MNVEISSADSTGLYFDLPRNLVSSLDIIESVSLIAYQDIIIADSGQRNSDERKDLWLGVAVAIDVSNLNSNFVNQSGLWEFKTQCKEFDIAVRRGTRFVEEEPKRAKRAG